MLPGIEAAAAELYAGVGLGDAAANDSTSVEDFTRACGQGLLWVAAIPGGAPVGFAFAELYDGIPHLDELGVHPAHGRRGLGTALVDALCTWARGAGYAAVTLSTYVDVPWNMPWYTKLGFHVLDRGAWGPDMVGIEAAERAIGLDASPRVMMRKDLSVRDA